MTDPARDNGKKVGAVLVVGGGIAGIQASIDLAECGQKVYLLETSAAIGGVMATLDKTFPTNDCSTCILSPKLVEAGRYLNIELLTYADLESIEGEPGNFTVKVKKRPRFVDEEKCTGCALCGKVDVPDPEELVEFEGELWVRRLAIDEVKCVQCGDCVRTCVEENPEAPAMSSIHHDLMQAGAMAKTEKKTGATDLVEVLGRDPEARADYWRHHMAKCIKCYGCRDICPVFIEEECRMEDWARPGFLPPDAPLYHLARAYYIGETCTHCGFCEDTCPSNLPLRALVDLIRHEEAENLFTFVAGLAQDQQAAIQSSFPTRAPAEPQAEPQAEQEVQP